MFIGGFILGTFVGAIITVLILSLCAIAGESDKK